MKGERNFEKVRAMVPRLLSFKPYMPFNGKVWLPRGLLFLACARFWRCFRRSGRRIFRNRCRKPSCRKLLPSSGESRCSGPVSSPELQSQVLTITTSKNDVATGRSSVNGGNTGLFYSFERLLVASSPAVASSGPAGPEAKVVRPVQEAPRSLYMLQRIESAAITHCMHITSSRLWKQDTQFVGVRTTKPVSLRSLSRDEVEELAGITAGGQNEVVVELKSGEVVHTCDMKLLLFGGWLNSEVINTYMALIEMRSERNWNLGGSKDIERVSSRVCAYSSFFCKKLMTYGYDGVRRWKNNINWYDYDIILIPVNYFQAHWTLVAVSMQRQTVEYYDSLLGCMSADAYARVINAVKDCLVKMTSFKLGMELNMGEWTQQVMEDGIPQQEDGSGCGVFVCVFADLLARGVRPPFYLTQEEVTEVRHGIAADLLAGRVS